MATNEEKVIQLGLLNEKGECVLPDDIAAFPTGYVAPGLPASFFREENACAVQGAIDKGFIKFCDGNGHKLTFGEYVAKYPEYPDPIFVLSLQGRWPPQEKKFVNIGGV